VSSFGDAGPPATPLSPVVRAGQFLFVSGQVPLDGRRPDPPDGIEAQTRLVLERIRGLLEDVGADMSRVVKTTVYLRDVSDFEGMNVVYAQFFPTNPPARTTVGVSLVVDARIEIDAIALSP
jgi:2-iminobutanoate/2-iminopropanoate deaminase